MTLETLLITLLALNPLYMAWTSRMVGGGRPKLPSPCDELLYAIPYLAFLWPVGGFWSFVAYGQAVIGKRIGTSPYLDLGWDKEPTDKVNPVDFIIRPLKGKISVYSYESLGMALTGVWGVLGPVVLLACTGNVISAIIILLSGAAKGLAYMIGWEIFPNYWGTVFGIPVVATEIGEYLSGAFAALGLLVVFLLMHTYK